MKATLFGPEGSMASHHWDTESNFVQMLQTRDDVDVGCLLGHIVLSGLSSIWLHKQAGVICEWQPRLLSRCQGGLHTSPLLGAHSLVWWFGIVNARCDHCTGEGRKKAYVLRVKRFGIQKEIGPPTPKSANWGPKYHQAKARELLSPNYQH